MRHRNRPYLVVSDLGLKRKILGQVFFVRTNLDLLIGFSRLVVFHCLSQRQVLNSKWVSDLYNDMVVLLLMVQNMFIF